MVVNKVFITLAIPMETPISMVAAIGAARDLRRPSAPSNG
jgi:hypothetical protein